MPWRERLSRKCSPRRRQSRRHQAIASQQMPSAIPNKSEPASSAFKQLDVSHRGYVTKEETAALKGFDKLFGKADTNRDGKLSPSEFRVAWAAYANNKQPG